MMLLSSARALLRRSVAARLQPAGMAKLSLQASRITSRMHGLCIAVLHPCYCRPHVHV